MIKKILGIILIVILIGLVCNYKLVMYGIEQGIGQIKIVYNARPISEVLQESILPDSSKQKLLFIQEIKKFAEDSLGITPSKNYSTYYDQKGLPAIWVITGSDPFKLNAYQWSFPIIGSFTYKGFFNKEKAKKEELELIKNGYDADLGTASGWSTLGWFKDPVLSSMLRRKEGSLANLIIHELTHGTLYIKDSVDYNENLASFVGDKGAIQFLNFKFGLKSAELSEYEQGKEDRDNYNAHILRGAHELDILYKSFKTVKKTSDKIDLKKNLIKEIIKSLDTINFYNKSYYNSSSLDIDSINNTFFIGSQRYNGKQDRFEEEFGQRFNHNLKAYLIFLKKKYPSL